MPSFLTIAAPTRLEIPRIKGSRFIADARPVMSEKDAQSHLAALQAEFPDASHHCYAWVLDEQTHRSSDDGEPAGSAGIPILKPILGQSLRYLSIIVVRYFGGTKLGVGGLMRAYSQASKEVLQAAEIIEEVLMTSRTIHCHYASKGPIEGLLLARGGEVVKAAYDERVALEIRIPEDKVKAFEAELTELTSGGAEIHDPE